MRSILQPFDSSWLKVFRADIHIKALEAEIDAFLAVKPFKIVIENPNPPVEGVLYWAARILKPPPIVWTAQIGDVIHNLRSALDLMASDLVRLNGHRHDNVSFPFSSLRADLENQMKSKNFAKSAADVVDLLRYMKPYTGGNASLRGLHDLNIRDKHQALIPAIGYVTISGLSLDARRVDGTPYRGQTIDLPTWETSFVEDRTVIWIMPSSIAGAKAGEVIPCDFKIVFPPGVAFAGEDVTKTLRRLRKDVASAIEDFQALCESRPNAVAQFEQPLIGSVFQLREAREGTESVA